MARVKLASLKPGDRFTMIGAPVQVWEVEEQQPSKGQVIVVRRLGVKVGSATEVDLID